MAGMDKPVFSWMERFMIAERAVPFLLAWGVFGYLLMASVSRPFRWEQTRHDVIGSPPNG